MCGLTAIVSLRDVPDLRSAIERMTATLVHRGPDDAGTLVEGAVALGFRRLSILDLEQTGHQPMTSADGSVTIIFNGEIFNYVELRAELKALGHTFRSTGDTEVLLHAYRQWGTDCLSRLNGMWAFLILDRRRALLFGSRDRFGVKPLFMHRSSRWVLFGSEIKAIRASGLGEWSVDWGTAADFLVRHRLDESQRTFFAGIEQVPPGTAFELGLDGRFRQWSYWSLPTDAPAAIPDPVERYRELFEDAVRLRTRSDVPLGVFLSGGIDSTSIICALARGRDIAGGELRAFSFMDPRFDESRFIEDTVQQTGAELERVEYGSEDIWADLPKVLWHHDQPVHSTTALIGFRLSQAAAARGIKVILNGQGADETAAGYPSYFEPFWHTVLATQGPAALWRELQQHALLWGGSPVARYAAVLRHVLTGQPYRFEAYRRLRSRLDLEKDRRHPWFTRALLDALEADDKRTATRLDLNTELRASVEQTPLPLYLRIEDRNSMAHSVEIRVPFLDYRLVSLLFSLPGHLKMRGPYNKHLIREAMRGRIPESVRTRHEKFGFPSPSGAWMAELSQRIRDEIDTPFARGLGIFDVAAILRDLECHIAGQVDLGGPIFDVLQFLIWARATSASGSLAQP